MQNSPSLTLSIAVLADCSLARLALAASDANLIGGAGWVLNFSPHSWYPNELSSRTLMQRGVYAEQDGMQVMRMSRRLRKFPLVFYDNPWPGAGATLSATASSAKLCPLGVPDCAINNGLIWARNAAKSSYKPSIPISSLPASSTSFSTTATLAILFTSAYFLVALLQMVIVWTRQLQRHAVPESTLPEPHVLSGFAPEVQQETTAPDPLAQSSTNDSMESEQDVRLAVKEIPKVSPDPEAMAALQRARETLKKESLVTLQSVIPSSPPQGFSEVSLCSAKAAATFCKLDPNDETIYPSRDKNDCTSPLAPGDFVRYSLCLDTLDACRRNGIGSRCVWIRTQHHDTRTARSVPTFVAGGREQTKRVATVLLDSAPNNLKAADKVTQQTSGGWFCYGLVCGKMLVLSTFSTAALRACASRRKPRGCACAHGSALPRALSASVTTAVSGWLRQLHGVSAWGAEESGRKDVQDEMGGNARA
ncbi:hypothetical protein BDZ88DRAFT_439267 [Geranomyces variabilis]|nr:hypothetical protein BDZ88DRAFT_439267 [Geranomyces variabilis]KAJ3133385.1 hypothetical protein HDU90_006334 [Geranomyces variabilis]